MALPFSVMVSMIYVIYGTPMMPISCDDNGRKEFKRRYMGGLIGEALDFRLISVISVICYLHFVNGALGP